ncbi:hypothetical protein ACIRPT_02815 [Streptomyces sp. NPDC101227]|uniref:DUF7144 family membrane protein n=1 Tax=Streptomyces sp. NPDC101227 TaxID=3366136 RepID=UPI00382A2A05
MGNAPRTAESSTAAAGWTLFAAVVMIFGGIMAIFEGISAIATDKVFISTSHYVFQFNLTAWGWIHLILGIVVAIAGVALFTGATWARVVGVVVAGLSMVLNFIWLPYFPLWAIVVIALDAFVIWALCTSSQPLVEEG